MDSQRIQHRFEQLTPFLDERLRRLLAAAEAAALGYGGVSAVARVTGVSRRAITNGLQELQTPGHVSRIRRPGGGRKALAVLRPDLPAALESLVEPATRGDPQTPLLWTCKSTRHLAQELQQQGYQVSHQTVAELLAGLGYSLQANRKVREGSRHPDRNAQFEYLNERVRGFQERGQPVISVDAKKKELIGDFKNGGTTWRPRGEPEPVRVHDFALKEQGKAAPYGVSDMTRNEGWVNVGRDKDTAAFAVESIRRWWRVMGQERYPAARQLLVTADGGGSNGSRVRLWKVSLQQLANETGLRISVCHLPPGTSKWNKIEHRLFAYSSQNWRRQPLVSMEVIINLIAHTRTETGLRVECQVDVNKYPQGLKVSDEELAAVNLVTDEFHGEWNYTIAPNILHL